MTTKREGDETSKSWFRSSRFFQQDGMWFFLTREATTEGPFGDRNQAQSRLESYIKVIQSGILAPGIENDPTIMPKD